MSEGATKTGEHDVVEDLKSEEENVTSAAPKATKKERRTRLDFYPFAYAVFSSDIHTYCWYCMGDGTHARKCLGCGLALFCNDECQKLGWKDHKAECKGLKRTMQIPDIETRLLGRLVVRYKDILNNKDKKIADFYKDRSSERDLMAIWSHREIMLRDAYAMNKFNAIYENLLKFYDAKYLLSKEIVFEIHSRNYINRHAVSDKSYMKEIGKGLYLDLCRYDHSCRPNAIYTCDGLKATLRALDDTVDLDDIANTHYCYIDMLISQPQRTKLLRDTWYFNCQCVRCTDPAENKLTGVLCPNCPSDLPTTLCVFGEHDYKSLRTGLITCPNCHESLTQEQILDGLNAMRFIDRVIEDKEIEQMPFNNRLEFLEDMLQRFEKVLPKINVYLCRVIQLLIPELPSNAYVTLLKLHLQAYECVRYCYPAKHPALAFHHRNVGVFLNNLGQNTEAVEYIKEAQEIMEYVLDYDHPMCCENRRLLNQCIAGLLDEYEPQLMRKPVPEPEIIPIVELPPPQQPKKESKKARRRRVAAAARNGTPPTEDTRSTPTPTSQANSSGSATPPASNTQPALSNTERNRRKREKKKAAKERSRLLAAGGTAVAGEHNDNAEDEVEEITDEQIAVVPEIVKETSTIQKINPAEASKVNNGSVNVKKEDKKEGSPVFKKVISDDLFCDDIDDLPSLVE